MRRVVLAIAGTIAGLVVLLTFKSHTGTSAVSAVPAGTAGPGGAGGSSSGGPDDKRSRRDHPLGPLGLRRRDQWRRVCPVGQQRITRDGHGSR